MTRQVTLALSAALLATAACSASTPPPTAPGGGAEQSSQSDDILREHPEKDPSRAGIQISDRIRQACGLQESEAYFAFDSAKVSAKADAVLTKIAECFKTGPLAGVGLKLIGHADPRGDEEYNMALGGKRASGVATALARKGLAEARMSSTSRGEMDAEGTDDASWGKDRRVDLMTDE